MSARKTASPRARKTSARPPINSVVSGEDDPAAALETLATRLFAFRFVEPACAACFFFRTRAGVTVPPRPRRAVDAGGAGGGGGATPLWYTGAGETGAGGGAGGGEAGGWTGALRAGGGCGWAGG